MNWNHREGNIKASQVNGIRNELLADSKETFNLITRKNDLTTSQFSLRKIILVFISNWSINANAIALMGLYAHDDNKK